VDASCYAFGLNDLKLSHADQRQGSETKQIMKKQNHNKTEGAVGVGTSAVLGVWEPGRTLHAEITGCDDVWPELDDDEKSRWIESEKTVLEKFCGEVNRIAENNMLKTGKLEGSHFAAMKSLMAKYS
jgi:hypothetical protein